MARPLWVSVEAGIADSAKVWRFALALFAPHITPLELQRSPSRTDVAAAIGHLVQLWLKVADKRETGDISDVPDGLLATWAGWEGDIEHFADCFKDAFVSDGVIHDWRQHQGKFIEYRAKERDRWQQRKADKADLHTAGVTSGDTNGASTGVPPEAPPPNGYGYGSSSKKRSQSRSKHPKEIASDAIAPTNGNGGGWPAAWAADYLAIGILEPGRIGKRCAVVVEKYGAERARKMWRHYIHFRPRKRFGEDVPDHFDTSGMGPEDFVKTAGEWFAMDELAFPPRRS